jgi:outer membrane protein OmpU
MKKYLLGTTALAVAALMASPLSAAEKAKKLQLGVGGYMEHAFGYADSDDLPAETGDAELNAVGIESDAELHFRGKVTTDNGIKFDAKYELEANRDGDGVSVDEVFVQISTSSMGLLEIGSADSVASNLSTGAPKVGWGLHDADDWIRLNDVAWSSNTTGGNSDRFSDDVQKVSYYTPSNWKKATGLQAAGSFTPSGGGGSAINTGGSTVSAGLGFNRKVNGVGVYAQYNWTNRTDVGEGHGVIGHGTGLQLKMGNTTVSGAYTRTIAGEADQASSVDGHGYSIGASHKMGKWSVGLAYAKTVEEADATLGDDKISAWDLGAKYDLGKKISWRTSLYHLKQDDEAGVAANERSNGWAVVTGIVLGF